MERAICTLDSIPSSDSFLNLKRILCGMLGIPCSANDAEIKKAFFKFAKRGHPDKSASLSELADQVNWSELSGKYFLFRTMLSEDPVVRTIAMVQARSLMLAIENEDYFAARWLMPLIANYGCLPGTRFVCLIKRSVAENFAPGFFHQQQYPVEVCSKTAYGLAVLSVVSKLLPLSRVSCFHVEKTLFRVMQRMTESELGSFMWFLVKYQTDEETIIRVCFPPGHHLRPRGMSLVQYTANLVAAAVFERRIYVAFRAAQTVGIPGAGKVILRELAYSTTFPLDFPVGKRQMYGSSLSVCFNSAKILLQRYAGLEHKREQGRTPENPEAFRRCPFSSDLARVIYPNLYRAGVEYCDAEFRGNTLTAHFLNVHSSDEEWAIMAPCRRCTEPRLIASEKYPGAAMVFELEHQTNCDKAFKPILGHRPYPTTDLLTLPDDFVLPAELGQVLKNLYQKVSKPGIWTGKDCEDRMIFRIYE